MAKFVPPFHATPNGQTTSEENDVAAAAGLPWSVNGARSRPGASVTSRPVASSHASERFPLWVALRVK